MHQPLISLLSVKSGRIVGGSPGGASERLKNDVGMSEMMHPKKKSKLNTEWMINQLIQGYCTHCVQSFSLGSVAVLWIVRPKKWDDNSRFGCFVSGG